MEKRSSFFASQYVEHIDLEETKNGKRKTNEGVRRGDLKI
jgi:hypothetical protein